MMAKEMRMDAVQSREAMIQWITETSAVLDMQYPVDVRITTHDTVLDCYAVFWIWMRHITKHLKEKWPDAYCMLDNQGEMMHDMMCMMFLGKTKPMKIGKTVVDSRQRTLTSPKMNKGEMVDFLRKIEEWSIKIGVTLPQPPSEYSNE